MQMKNYAKFMQSDYAKFRQIVVLRQANKSNALLLFLKEQYRLRYTRAPSLQLQRTLFILGPAPAIAKQRVRM